MFRRRRRCLGQIRECADEESLTTVVDLKEGTKVRRRLGWINGGRDLPAEAKLGEGGISGEGRGGAEVDVVGGGSGDASLEDCIIGLVVVVEMDEEGDIGCIAEMAEGEGGWRVEEEESDGVVVVASRWIAGVGRWGVCTGPGIITRNEHTLARKLRRGRCNAKGNIRLHSSSESHPSSPPARRGRRPRRRQCRPARRVWGHAWEPKQSTQQQRAREQENRV